MRGRLEEELNDIVNGRITLAIGFCGFFLINSIVHLEHLASPQDSRRGAVGVGVGVMRRRLEVMNQQGVCKRLARGDFDLQRFVGESTCTSPGVVDQLHSQVPGFWSIQHDSGHSNSCAGMLTTGVAWIEIS